MRAAAALALALLAAAPIRAQARIDTTARTITIPVPEEGVIYIRSGPPGGVRIRRSSASSPGEVEVDGPPIDLERITRALDRQGLSVRAEAVRDGERMLVVLRDSATGLLADTLTAAEASDLADSFGAPTGPQSVADSVVRQVERSLLDGGVFRSIQVHFAFDDSELLSSSLAVVDAVVNVLDRHPDLRIEIAGHTDSVGSAPYNDRLSRRRAQSVAEYLVRRGIASNRLRPVGYGEARPLLSNATETGRALNRRAEFVVLSEGRPLDAEIPVSGELE